MTKHTEKTVQNKVCILGARTLKELKKKAFTIHSQTECDRHREEYWALRCYTDVIGSSLKFPVRICKYEAPDFIFCEQGNKWGLEVTSVVSQSRRANEKFYEKHGVDTSRVEISKTKKESPDRREYIKNEQSKGQYRLHGVIHGPPAEEDCNCFISLVTNRMEEKACRIDDFEDNIPIRLLVYISETEQESDVELRKERLKRSFFCNICKRLCDKASSCMKSHERINEISFLSDRTVLITQPYEYLCGNFDNYSNISLMPLGEFVKKYYETS